MAAIVSALDNFTPSQIGENGSTEYTWSHDMRERIIQLSFQLTRVSDASKINDLAMQTNKILNELSASYKVGNLQREVYVEYMSLMYRMIGHTRDIIDGKGEYTLSYMLLEVWYNYNPELAKFAFRHFLLSPEGKENV